MLFYFFAVFTAPSVALLFTFFSVQFSRYKLVRKNFISLRPSPHRRRTSVPFRFFFLSNSNPLALGFEFVLVLFKNYAGSTEFTQNCIYPYLKSFHNAVFLTRRFHIAPSVALLFLFFSVQFSRCHQGYRMYPQK